MVFIGVLLLAQNIHGQADSTLTLDKLDKNDLIKPESVKKESQVYAASRMPEEPEELPGKVYIIYQEEILENGYSTLVDVLKTIPGFRTSQPGTAEMGETFIMRGLLGNAKTRIMINGTPVKPFSQEGMDIGAQLPIRQADRIEIILGPAASLYGSDAVAGVINIVIDETDRPLETMVNIAGSSGTLTETHVSLGGKMFRDKNVLRFNFFGNFRSITNYNLAMDDIRVDTNAITTPYFVGEDGDPTKPEIRNIHHSSSLIGTRLDYRGFTYNFQTLYRLETSGVGSHPQIIDFTDVGSYFANRSFHHALTYNKTFKKYWTVTTNLSALWYKIDNNSSYKGTSHPISNGKNFLYGESRDILLEQLISYNRKNLKVLLGGTAFNSSGIAQFNYLAHPWNPDKTETIDGHEMYNTTHDQYSYIDSIQEVPRFKQNNFSAFTQIFYRIGPVNIVGGVRAEFLQDYDLILNPKIGIVYKIMDNLRLRASYSKASQEPSPTVRNNHYVLQIDSVGPGVGLRQIGYKSTPLEPVHLENIEAGINYKISKTLSIDINYFRHTINNNLFPRAQFPDKDMNGNYLPGIYEIGYFNLNSESVLNGIELYTKFENRSWRADLGFVYNIGHEAIDDLQDIEKYRNVPDVMIHGNVRYKFQGNIFTLNSSYFGAYIENVTLVKDEFIKRDVSGYYNIDLAYTRILKKQFYLFVKVTNLTNAKVKGINTNWLTAYPYEYIPQLNRQFTLGLTYNLR